MVLCLYMSYHQLPQAVTLNNLNTVQIGNGKILSFELPWLPVYFLVFCWRHGVTSVTLLHCRLCWFDPSVGEREGSSD